MGTFQRVVADDLRAFLKRAEAEIGYSRSRMEQLLTLARQASFWGWNWRNRAKDLQKSVDQLEKLNSTYESRSRGMHSTPLRYILWVGLTLSSLVSSSLVWRFLTLRQT
jgi:hypothetical protein